MCLWQLIRIIKHKYGEWLLGTQATVVIDQVLSFHKLAQLQSFHDDNYENRCGLPLDSHLNYEMRVEGNLIKFFHTARKKYFNDWESRRRSEWKFPKPSLDDGNSWTWIQFQYKSWNIPSPLEVPLCESEKLRESIKVLLWFIRQNFPVFSHAGAPCHLS